MNLRPVAESRAVLASAAGQRHAALGSTKPRQTRRRVGHPQTSALTTLRHAVYGAERAGGDAGPHDVPLFLARVRVIELRSLGSEMRACPMRGWLHEGGPARMADRSPLQLAAQEWINEHVVDQPAAVLRLGAVGLETERNGGEAVF